jgi:hypothetical protein
MQVKIDENLPASVADVFRGHGHDADTVAQEGLGGREALLQQVALLLEAENLESWHGCLVIASERKVRVIGPARGGSGALERSETEP